MPSVQLGDKWLLERHLIYCEDTSSDKFINPIPSKAALAIVTPTLNWKHDYLIDKANIVIVIVEEDRIYNFCTCQQMPFQFELLINNLYIAVFSTQFIHKLNRPTEIDGIEGVVSYLIDRYTTRGDLVLAPFVKHGEVLIVSERMGRICIAGDKEPNLVSRAIARWQNLTNKQAKKELNLI